MPRILNARLFTLAVAATILSPALLHAAEPSPAGRVVFHRDILPILQENCQVCHRAGGTSYVGMVAPMSLMTYREVRPWAKAIQKAVSSRKMPPWGASEATKGVFANERVLTEAEIATITRWVETGAARGDPGGGPPALVFENAGGWSMGEPDLILRMPEPYFVPDEAQDIQPTITWTITEEELPEARWVRAAELKPGSEAVHHLNSVIFIPEMDGQPSERFSLGSVAAGVDPQVFPPGFGNVLKAGAEISLNMHYHKEPGPGTAVYDQSYLGVMFHPKDAVVKYKMNWGRIVARDFEIPPRHPDWTIGASMTFDRHTLITSLFPHMHYRGKDMKYTAHYPDGSTELLLEVPQYDFNWQIQYRYREPKILPPGTRIDVLSHFDNSEERRAIVPQIDIGRPVIWGLSTTDEMPHGLLGWTYIEAEDVDAIRAGTFDPAKGRN